jgi:hypothetical protein
VTRKIKELFELLHNKEWRDMGLTVSFTTEGEPMISALCLPTLTQYS